MKARTFAVPFIVVGSILLLLGLVIELILFPSVLRSMVIEEMKLEQGTEGWSNFVSKFDDVPHLIMALGLLQLVPPVPVYMKFVFFVVENPDEILIGGKPKVSERGPYAYREYREKHNLLPFTGDTLQYEQTVQYVFDQR